MKPYSLFCLLLCGSILSAASPVLKQDGIELPTELGSIRVGWPAYAADNSGKRITAKAVELGDGKARLTFNRENLPEITVLVEDSGKVTFHYESGGGGMLFYPVYFPQKAGRKLFYALPDDGELQEFPVNPPDSPRFARGQFSRMLCTNRQTAELLFEWSPKAYIEIQDNRKWNWPVYQLTIHGTIPAKSKPVTVTLDFKLRPVTEKAPVEVVADRYGQSIKASWPGKVTSDDELRADVAKDREFFQSFRPLPTDAFGGLIGEKARNTSAEFFTVGKWRNHDVFVTPAGNPLFQLGVCTVAPCDDYTFVQGREEVFAELPPRIPPFDTAWMNRDVVSFYIVNVIRKTGKPFLLAEWKKEMVYRLKQMGFNSQGPFRNTPDLNRALSFPWCPELPFQGVKMLVADLFDPFDPATREAIDRNFSSLQNRKDDPTILGYFSGNERKYSELAARILDCDGKTAAKRELADFLQKRYKTTEAFSHAWEIPIQTFNELPDMRLILKTPAAWADINDYSAIFFDAYFRLIHDTFRKYDPNHLLLGARFLPAQTRVEPALRAAGKYNDVFSVNYYSYEIEEYYLDQLHQLTGRPILLSEWHFGSTEQGLSGAVRPVKNQEERALAYRKYVEQAAALPYVIGVQYFSLLDQALTGRWFQKYQGENMNIGFFNVADRPYRELAMAAAESHSRVYDIIRGTVKPFGATLATTSKNRTVKNLYIPRALSGHQVDGIRSPWPERPSERLGRENIVFGRTADISADFWLCWDKDNLYLYADVADSTPGRNPFASADFWQGDALELFFGPQELDKAGQLRFHDRQLLLAAKPNGGFFWANQEIQPNVKSVIRPWVDGKGYSLEAAIPWETLSIAPKTGAEFRFDLGIDYSDGEPRSHQLMWSGTGRNNEDRTYWGSATLVD